MTIKSCGHGGNHSGSICGGPEFWNKAKDIKVMARKVGNPGRGTSQSWRTKDNGSVGITAKRSKKEKMETGKCPLGLATRRLRVGTVLCMCGSQTAAA